MSSLCSLQVLYPSCHVKDLRLWTSVYMPEMGEVTADTTTSAHPSVGDEEVSPAARIRGRPTLGIKGSTLY